MAQPRPQGPRPLFINPSSGGSSSDEAESFVVGSPPPSPFSDASAASIFWEGQTSSPLPTPSSSPLPTPCTASPPRTTAPPSQIPLFDLTPVESNCPLSEPPLPSKPASFEAPSFDASPFPSPLPSPPHTPSLAALPDGLLGPGGEIGWVGEIEPESPRSGGPRDEVLKDVNLSICPYTSPMVATRSGGPRDEVSKEGSSSGGQRKNIHSPHRISPPDAPLRKRSIHATVNVSAHVSFEDDMDAWAADVLLHCSQEGASHEVLCYDDCPQCIAACPLNQVDPREEKIDADADERPSEHGGGIS